MYDRSKLLGVQGIVIVGHGNSQAKSFRNAIKHAQECVDSGFNELIAKEVDENLSLLEEAGKKVAAL